MYAADALAGQTIFVTGGGIGLGRAMALRFAELREGDIVVSDSTVRARLLTQELWVLRPLG